MRHLRRRLAAASLALAASVASGQEPAAPAASVSESRQAFDELNDWRSRHASVIWGRQAATPEELRAVLADLDRGLALAGNAHYRALGDGSMAVRARRLDLLVDKAKVLDRLGEREGAIRALGAAGEFSWIDPRQLGGADGDAELKAIVADPRAAGLRARYALARRFGDGSALLTPYRPRLSEAERVAGLSRIWSVARDGFVWFDHVPALDWDRAYLDALPRVIAARDTDAYYRELVRFTALLQDGHSNAYPPEALQSRWYARPGLRTQLVEGRVVVTRVLDASLSARGLRVGDELLAIDGVPVKRYAAGRVAPFQSSSTPQDRDVRSYEYLLLGGDAARAAHLELAHADGTRLRLDARRRLAPWADPRPPQAFELRDDGVAVIRASEFEDDAAPALFEQHVDEVMAAKALVIDLRHNGGGSSEFGWRLLAWLQDGALPAMRSRTRSETALTQVRSEGAFWPIWLPEADDAIVLPHARTFRGPVAMLVDAATFSAGEDTAATFKWMRRGPVVGMPTGGSTGQPLRFALPGGGTARICIKRDSYPDGSDFVGQGVQPDVQVPLRVDDVRAGRDAAMARAVALLLAPGR